MHNRDSKPDPPVRPLLHAIPLRLLMVSEAVKKRAAAKKARGGSDAATAPIRGPPLEKGGGGGVAGAPGPLPSLYL